MTKKYIANSRGSAMIMVLIAVTVLILLGFAITTLSMGTLVSNTADANKNEAYYAAEAGASCALEQLKLEVVSYYNEMNSASGYEYSVLHDDFFTAICDNANSNFVEPRIEGATIQTTFTAASFDANSNVCEYQISSQALCGSMSYTVNGLLKVKRINTQSLVGSPFNYAVCSSDLLSTLTINGSDTTIVGSVHSNYKFSSNGSNISISGDAEAVLNFSMNGSNNTIGGTCQAAQISISGSNNNIGTKVFSAAPIVEMPDFSAMIQAEAAAAGTAYNGNKKYNGSNITVDSPIYVDGNLTVNGSNFSGTGIILVSGSITFNGSNLKSAGSSVCFYSKSGNITINGSNAQLDGLLYAPNGTIKMNGSNQTINGRIVAKKINFNGSNYIITAKDEDLESLPIGSVEIDENIFIEQKVLPLG